MGRTDTGDYPFVVAVNIDRDTAAAVAAAAARLDRSRAWIGRQALTEWLDRHNDGQDPPDG